MSDVFDSVWLYADSFSATPVWSTYTLVIPRSSIFAQIALSTVVPALHAADRGGWAAGTQICKYSYYESADNVREVILNDFNQNSIWIEECTSVTFGLTVKWGWAYATASVFTI